ncbi:MAG TPA: radical SAM protein [Defluviitoga sp.]|nr:radical SAM protein [Defluviitoga sp.]HOP24587.1 radical SAM protein [Defluviitoga sp.]HPZ29321.1 radical SAM protein [Defluviitoga sp.]HQD63253.1 radical SAM protein [Defluviitoga sp.]
MKREIIFKPIYVKSLEDGILLDKVDEAKKHLTQCHLCPRECGVNRTTNIGFCRAPAEVIVSSVGPHFGEEHVLVGSRGSGTIFFGFCNMRCVYCQNYELSFEDRGKIVSNKELADMMLLVQNHYKCHNINLVTPTHFVPNIIEALYIAAQKGLNLPIVYNCGGYESVETLKILDGIIDIYMPDFKYISSEKAKKYSQAPDYPEKVKLALKEMDRQVGGLKLDEKAIAYRGLLIRHLMLPGCLDETKTILEFIKQELSQDCLVNLMKQYYPTHRAFEYDELRRRVSFHEYQEAYAYAQKLGLRLC